MNTLEIPEIGKKYYIPSDLSECDPRQYAEVSNLLYEHLAGMIDYETFRIHALYALLNMQPGENPDPEVQEEKAANIYQVSTLLDSFFEETEKKWAIKQYYTHNPIPELKHVHYHFVGPANNLDDVCGGAYLDGLNYYQEYNATGEKEMLYRLMATFYRKKGQRYKESQVLGIAKKLKEEYWGNIYGFYLFFASFQKYLYSSKIYYMGNELDLSILFEADPDYVDSGLPGLGLKSNILSLAESGILGTLKEVRAAKYLGDFYVYVRCAEEK